MRAAILADTHLPPGGGEPTGRLLTYLATLAPRGCRDLYLLGDIFHTWIGPRHARREDYRTALDGLANLRRAGVRVTFLPGNRDFHLDRGTGRRLGIRVAGDRLTATLGGTRVFLAHGDLFCPGDVRYLSMRRVIRSAPARILFRLLPERWSLAVVHGMRGMSVREIARKPPAVFRLSEDLVRDVLRAGHDACVLGHVHRAQARRLPIGGRAGTLFTLGDWHGKASYVEVDDDGRLTLFDGDPPAPVAVS